MLPTDHDGVYNHADSCPSGHTGWVSVDSNDYDGMVAGFIEDHDDDDDSILDVLILARSQVILGATLWFLVAVQVHTTMIPTDAMTPTRTPMI